VPELVRERLVGPDALRLVAIFAVVCIHVFDYPGVDHSPTGDAVLVVSRFAVPFFFIASGFFMGRSASQGITAQAARIALRLSVIWLFWIAVYLAVSYARNGEILQFWHMRTLLTLMIQGYSAYHLWFIPSLIMSSVCVLMAKRLFGWTACLVLASCSYAVGLALINYFRFPDPYAHHAIASAERTAFGFALVMGGYWLSAARRLPGLKASVWILLFGLCGQFIEVYLGHAITGTPVAEIEFAFSTALLATGALLVALQLDLHSMPLALRLSSRYVLGIYCVHLLFIKIIMTYAHVQSTTFTLAVVAVLSFTLSAATAVAIGFAKPLRRLVRA
jgi:surface polysaccharide O-acyltransferase-like enzyme